MSRRNRTNKPRPTPLAASASTVDLAAEARAAIPARPSGSGKGKGRSATAVSVNVGGSPPWWASLALGQINYRDVAFASRPDNIQAHDTWGYYLNRKLRYDVFWGHYEGNVYAALHRWAAALKTDRQLYAYTRTIFSPAYRIGEFWAGHLWGGPIDPAAGDGIAKPSALPIAIEDGVDPAKAQSLRDVISDLWSISNWQSKKDIVTRFGAVKGDVGVVIHDDADGQAVSLRVVDPRTIADLRRDTRGNVKEYILQERRPDPEADTSGPFARYQVTYTEWCRKVGDSVVFTTYRDGQPYDWREYPEGTPADQEVGPSWSEPYDFVPMVFIQHRDFGQGWGWSELQPDFGKMYELDDIASKLSDQIRKIVDCPWYIEGAAPGDVNVNLSDDVDGDGSGRQKTPIWYGPEGSAPHPMIAPLDIPAVSAHIKAILEDLERDHPELATDNVGLASSGEARRVAREKVEAMVVQRRSSYDDALVRAHQMAISVGAIKGYPGYEAFDAGSYERGDLGHTIGDRPVFAVDASDKLAEAAQRLAIVKTGTDAGLPVEYVLKHFVGSSDEQIEELKTIRDAQATADEAKAIRVQQAMMAGPVEQVPGTIQ